MTIPTFLVAGGARCGTTGVVEGPRAHPRDVVATPNEPHYFARHRTGASIGSDRSRATTLDAHPHAL